MAKRFRVNYDSGNDEQDRREEEWLNSIVGDEEGGDEE